MPRFLRGELPGRERPALARSCVILDFLPEQPLCCRPWQWCEESRRTGKAWMLTGRVLSFPKVAPGHLGPGERSGFMNWLRRSHAPSQRQVLSNAPFLLPVTRDWLYSSSCEFHVMGGGEDEHVPTVSSLHLFTVHPRSSVPVTCGGPCLSPAQVADKRQGEGPRASFISAVLLLNQHQVLAAKIDG